MNTEHFLNMQRQLQIGMKRANPTQGGDPYEMTADELATFVAWNVTALNTELGEALQEMGWKPWASDRQIHYPQALHEMVDAWHFFLNIMLAIGAWSGYTPAQIAEEFDTYYSEKNTRNLQRQIDGYNGRAEKCAQCGRDLAEAHCTKEICNA